MGAAWADMGHLSGTGHGFGGRDSRCAACGKSESSPAPPARLMVLSTDIRLQRPEENRLLGP